MDESTGKVKSFESHDPMEAIYALNIGDFMAEDFISDDLLDKISDRLANDPDKLKNQLEEMVQIYSIDKTLGILGFSSDEGFVIYDSIAQTLSDMFIVDACHIFQVTDNASEGAYLGLTGTSKTVASQNRWKIGIRISDNDLLGQIYQEGETRMLSGLDKNPNWHPIQELGQEETRALIAAPMVEHSHKLGLILFEAREDRAFSPELIELAEATARVFVTSIRLQQLVAQAQVQIRKSSPEVSELRNLRAQITESIADLGSHQQSFVEHLGAAIDARNRFTRGHSKHVAQIARTLADELRLNEKTVDLVYYAGLLGTVGKKDIPGSLLTKHEKLTPEEWDNLRNHPNVGVALLAQINFLSEVVPYVHYLYERWDGSGMPEGRKGRSIPLGSRILAVADAYQAMTAERPYRDKPLTHDEAVKLIQQEAGVKWDPAVVNALSNIPADSLV